MPGALLEVAQILAKSTVSEKDISKKLTTVSQIIFYMDERQLSEIWKKTSQQENANVRLLFIISAINVLTSMLDKMTI